MSNHNDLICRPTILGFIHSYIFTKKVNPFLQQELNVDVLHTCSNKEFQSDMFVQGSYFVTKWTPPSPESMCSHIQYNVLQLNPGNLNCQGKLKLL